VPVVCYNKLLITSINTSNLNIKLPKPLATKKRVINSAKRFNLKVYKNQFNHHTYQQNMLRLCTYKNRPNNRNHELTTLSGPRSGAIFCHVINAALAHIFFLSLNYVTTLGNAAIVPALSASSYKIPLFE
jgi:hypothetical protein